jgi:hypothetical protein
MMLITARAEIVAPVIGVDLARVARAGARLDRDHRQLRRRGTAPTNASP